MTLDLFAEDTHASPSVLPGSKEARQTTVISGRKCIDLLKISGRGGLLPRMLLDTSLWASTLCYLTWKPKTTPLGYLLFQLVPSTPSTEGTGYGLLATPNTMDSLPPKSEEAITREMTETRKGRSKPANPRDQVSQKLWPAPCSTKMSGTTREDFGESLPERAKRVLLPTPRASSAMNEKIGNIQKRQDDNSRLEDAVSRNHLEDSDISNLRLNPLFVEQMMGYPIDHTDLKPSETASSLRSLKSSGDQS